MVLNHNFFIKLNYKMTANKGVINDIDDFTPRPYQVFTRKDNKE